MKQFIIAVALLSAACGGSSPTAPSAPPPATTPTLTSVSMSAALTSLKQKGQTTPITVTGTFSNGTTSVVTSTCSNWQTDNPAVATVNSAGVITALATGTATATTTCQGVFGRGLITLNLLPDELWLRSGSGNTVFNLPNYVTRVHIQGRWQQRDTSNFIVHVNGLSLINEILRTSITYDGTHVVPAGGLIEIVSSSAIDWTFTEVR
jgi:Bacterial Ig-like domain (group 2)